MDRTVKPAADDGWIFDADSARDGIAGSRLAISNGFLGTTDTAPAEAGDPLAIPARTYIAGLFDTIGPDNITTALIPSPDWLRLSLTGPAARKLRRRSELDAERGVLLTEASPEAGPGMAVRALRLVSLHDRPIGLQTVQLEIEDGDLDITLQASVDASAPGLVPQRIDQALGVWRTLHSGQSLALAVAATLQIDGNHVAATALGPLTWSWRWTSRPGQIVQFQRYVAIARGDSPDADPAATARDALGQALQIGWRGVLDAHQEAWAKRWHYSDIRLAGDADAQRAVRFAAYHLNSAANPDDGRVSIGARALTGESYNGHVFWDTEIFLLPFYVLTWPEAARALLMYRFHTLGGARAKAKRMGWRGAMYAWESASTGDEMTPEHLTDQDGKIVAVLCGTQEQHISADIAYAVWQYWHTTGDDSFLQEAGAEILLETARFWASRALPEADGRCHIRGIIGPDENHEHIDDNVYTNVMARWNIRRALDAAALLEQRWPEQWATLAQRLGIDQAELQAWSRVAETIAICFDPKTGMYEQFAGFFDLEDIDLSHYAGRTVPVEVLLGQERTQQSQVAKQADVVALQALLPEEFPENTAERNFRYYEPRCSHRSSLSPAMHGLVASRLGDTEMALRFFRQTADIDLGGGQGPADGGVHIAALGGIWMLAVLGFAGLSVRDDGLALEPRLPEGWQSLSFRVQWRGRTVHFGIDHGGQEIAATLESGEPMIVVLGGERRAIQTHQRLTVGIG
jgi:trehalose/maltose hydrolase-like predicted phosphorylase